MSLRPFARVYSYAIIAAGSLALAGWLRFALSPPTLWSSPYDLSQALTMAQLVVLGLVAQQFPVPLPYWRREVLTDASYFAGLLLFGVPFAPLLVALSETAGAAADLFRGRRAVGSAVFDASRAVLAISLAAAASSGLPQPWAVLVAAAVWHVANTAIADVLVGLRLGTSPWALWLQRTRRSGLQIAGLLLIGWMTARAAPHEPWAPAIMALPALVIYLSMKRALQLREQTVEAMEALADVIDRRTPYTVEHSRRVATYAEALARAMKLSTSAVEAIRMAARVHDVGKIGVPDAVLLKPSKLTPEEWQQMRQHAQIGYEILAEFPEYRGCRDLVRYHHHHFERWEASALSTEPRVLLGAQIIALADAYDAMTSARPYRPPRSMMETLVEIKREKGVQWAPDVVEAFTRLVTQPDHPITTLLQPLPTPAA